MVLWQMISIVLSFIAGGLIGFVVSMILTVDSINDRIEEEVNDYLTNKRFNIQNMTDEEIDQLIEKFFQNTPKEELYRIFEKSGFFEEFKSNSEEINWDTFNKK